MKTHYMRGHLHSLMLYTGTKQIPAEPTKSTHYYEFFEKKQVYVMIQIPLQSIQGIDYNQLSDNFELSYKLLHNGKIIFDTTYRLSSRGYTSRVSEYRLINDSTVEANLTFFSPTALDVGIYEYQFYVRNEDVQRVLDITQCDTSYQNFLDGGMRLLFFLIGEATIYIEMAGEWMHAVSHLAIILENKVQKMKYRR